MVVNLSCSSNNWKLTLMVQRIRDRWRKYHSKEDACFWLLNRRGPLMERKQQRDNVMVVAVMNIGRCSVKQLLIYNWCENYCFKVWILALLHWLRLYKVYDLFIFDVFFWRVGKSVIVRCQKNIFHSYSKHSFFKWIKHFRLLESRWFLWKNNGSHNGTRIRSRRIISANYSGYEGK